MLRFRCTALASYASNASQRQILLFGMKHVVVVVAYSDSESDKCHWVNNKKFNSIQFWCSALHFISGTRIRTTTAMSTINCKSKLLSFSFFFAKMFCYNNVCLWQQTHWNIYCVRMSWTDVMKINSRENSENISSCVCLILSSFITWIHNEYSFVIFLLRRKCAFQMSVHIYLLHA